MLAAIAVDDLAKSVVVIAEEDVVEVGVEEVVIVLVAHSIPLLTAAGPPRRAATSVPAAMSVFGSFSTTCAASIQPGPAPLSTYGCRGEGG